MEAGSPTKVLAHGGLRQSRGWLRPVVERTASGNEGDGGKVSLRFARWAQQLLDRDVDTGEAPLSKQARACRLVNSTGDLQEITFV
jgi:hypothetical protein